VNGISYANPNVKPGQSPGQQDTFTYILTCANGTTITRTTVFYNPGVTGLQTVCGIGNVYSITYNNPLNHVVSTTAGTVSGNSIINIPVGTNVTLTVSDASGCGGNQQTVMSPCCSSPISIAACIPTVSGAASNIGITNFTFNTINSTSGLANTEGNYIDRTCNQQTTVSAGSTYPISITGAGLKYVFIDYNNNGVLNDVGETVVTSVANGNAYSGTITIPTTAVKGVPLRIRVKSDNSNSNNPCLLGFSPNSGQSEDFTLTIESVISSVQTGAWEANATWDLMRKPVAGDKVIINANHEVTINNANAVAKKIECKAMGKLIFNIATPKSKMALGL
jgi:GEVED domain